MRDPAATHPAGIVPRIHRSTALRSGGRSRRPPRITALALAVACLLVGPAGCEERPRREGSAGGKGATPADRRGESVLPDLSAGTWAGFPVEDSDRVLASFNRGVALMDRFQPAEAAKAFAEVVQLAPAWSTGRLNYAIALLNTQDEASIGRAEAELERVASQSPASPQAQYTLGLLLRRRNRFAEAVRRFERVLEIDPSDPDTHYQIGVLRMESDPAEARAHLEATLAAMPHHESACYYLQTLLRKAGEADRAQELLARFQALKGARAGAAPGMKYGEMGRYAEIVRLLPLPDPPPRSTMSPSPAAVPPYENAAARAGWNIAGAGKAGWPGPSGTTSPAAGASEFSGGVAVADIDGDLDLDVYFAGVGPQGRGVLYRRVTNRWKEDDDAGIDGRGAVAAFFGDYDADGDPDLYLTCAGPNRLFQNRGDGRFIDVTAATGTAGGNALSVGAAWADADHDGDLDLYVANFDAPNNLWRNNGDGRFVDAAPEGGLTCAGSRAAGALFIDLDDDRDLDLLVLCLEGPNRIFLNDRVGRYTDGARRFPELAGAAPALGALAGDLDLNGREDILFLRGPSPPGLFRQLRRGEFLEDPGFATLARSTGGAAGGLLGDLDLDGDLDIVLLDAGAGESFAHRILVNDGVGGFAAPVAVGGERRGPSSRGAVAADLDGNGTLELVVARSSGPPELWESPAAAERHWLQVLPVIPVSEAAARAGANDAADDAREPNRARWCDPSAVGLAVEVKSGRWLQAGRLLSSSGYLGGPPPRLHFGLGTRAKADYVRLAWPDGTLQSDLEVAADQLWQVPKATRKASSCPILFSWDGRAFRFVTDFLGVGGVGFFVSPGVYAPPDPTEDVRVPPELVAATGGRYLLRIAEPLEEVTYLDEIELRVYDHPRGTEVHPDERFASQPPWPTGEPVVIGEKVFPASARDASGRDVRDLLREVDRHYVEPPLDGRFLGYARDHWCEIDFTGRLDGLSPSADLVLCLHGWLEYTYSHVNYAAYQAGLGLRSPWCEAPDGRGGWRVALADAGFPAGLPRMMVLGLDSLYLRTDGRLRLRTNMEVYWDQIFLAEVRRDAPVRRHRLRAAAADLRPLGYPREYSPDGALPTLYDYGRIDPAMPFRNLAGDYTRFGDVRMLLDAADDRFVVMGRGEEIALEFDASELPALEDGWVRTLVLHADGYCKDMDLYTAFPETVKPLPFHAMRNYPPEEGERTPRTWAEYERTYNTRRVTGD